VKKSILNNFRIDIFRLENKQYLHEFEGGDDFFVALEQNLIEKGQFKAHITLDKNEVMIQMIYTITGSVELICDRSLEPFDFPFDIKQKMILKFSDHTEEVTDELMLIDRNMQYINVAQDVYEFIGLQIPMKKLHPRFRQEEDNRNIEYTPSFMESLDDDDDDGDYDFEDYDDETFGDRDSEGLVWDEEDEGEIVYSTGSKVQVDEEEEQPQNDKPIDPRWEALRKLNNN
jgi:uncharacterized metal-binding protein YceD (DUF177 family)